jgi:sec-independent protein translocase protein TatC
MFVAFGVAFEVPVAVALLARMGVVELAQLIEARPYVIVGAFVVAAIVTPPDVISQFLLAVPIILLYELGILYVRFSAKEKEEEEEGGLPVPTYQPPSVEELDRELDRLEGKPGKGANEPKQ